MMKDGILKDVCFWLVKTSGVQIYKHFSVATQSSAFTSGLSSPPSPTIYIVPSVITKVQPDQEKMSANLLWYKSHSKISDRGKT